MGEGVGILQLKGRGQFRQAFAQRRRGGRRGGHVFGEEGRSRREDKVVGGRSTRRGRGRVGGAKKTRRRGGGRRVERKKKKIAEGVGGSRDEMKVEVEGEVEVQADGDLVVGEEVEGWRLDELEGGFLLWLVAWWPGGRGAIMTSTLNPHSSSLNLPPPFYPPSTRATIHQP